MLKIEDSDFGEVTVDGETYQHDIVIFPDRTIKRKKWITKEKHGTSHKFTREEMQEYFDTIGDKTIDKVVVGSGQYGKLSLLSETERYLEEKDVDHELKKTGDLTGERIEEEKILVILHVTC